jgi:hypothetical protein
MVKQQAYLLKIEVVVVVLLQNLANGFSKVVL